MPGPTGPSGPSGPSGAASTVSGPSGPAGSVGASGPQGPSGQQGTQGASGPSGPSGPKGDAGGALGDHIYAYHFGNQNIGSTGYVPLLFTTIGVVDGWTMPDTTTFTVPTTGLYRIEWSAEVTGTLVQSLSALFLNGVAQQETVLSTFDQLSYTIPISRAVLEHLSANDTVQIRATALSGGTISVTNAVMVMQRIG
ncbi:MAG TPA: hypothetical protein VN449_02830 [Gaiellaceae bacterium]|nr:hypothetical protein [Gaiellaceae bacterium]